LGRWAAKRATPIHLYAPIIRRFVMTLLRLGFGLLTLAAIGSQLAIQIQGGYSVANFFSFFTNLSNLFATAVFLLGAFHALARLGMSNADDRLRAVSVVNMAVVGIVFSVLLRDVAPGSLQPWVNFELHYVMPCVAVLDWVLKPPKGKLGTKELFYVLVFPALYLAYVLVRGSYVGWYPYPFLNPANVGGYVGVATYVIAIAGTFLIAGWCLLAVGNKLHRRTVVGSN
jgi:hypothetical protein